MKLPLNIVDDTDFYKVTHHLGYKRGTTNIYSYGESRTDARFPHILFFGLQPILIDHLVGKIVTAELIEEASRKSGARGGHAYFNRLMWEAILHKYDGRLPIRIKAVKEGSKVPTSNVLFTIECLDPIAVPLVGHIETLLSHVWYTSTVCTNSYEIKKMQYGFLKDTGTPALIEYMCHDFGYRGTTCQQQAIRGGMAHMVNYCGSDTNVADRGIDYYYGYSQPSRLKSVFATEHSIAETFGEGEGEYDYIKHILTVAPKDAIVSIVVDTYNATNFIDNVITREDVKSLILGRAGKVVFRLDSGNAEEGTNRALNSLGNNFGYDYNRKHVRVLNPRIGLLYGDGMELSTIKSLYESIIANSWSADNLVVGSGGGLLQKFDRDVQSFAIKASYGIINGEAVNLVKSPATQSSKKSKKGMLKLLKFAHSFSTISSADTASPQFESYLDSLETVYEMGEMVRTQSFDEVINIANGYFMNDVQRIGVRDGITAE